MTPRVVVDATTLDSIALKLASAAQALGDLAPSAPQGVGVSAGSAATAAIVRHVITQAAHLCGELELAASGVVETRDAYGVTDDTTSATLQALSPDA